MHEPADAQPVEADPPAVSPERRRRWRRWLALGAVVVLAWLGVCSLVPSYHIPSGSMMPTLRHGDHVLANRAAYGSFGGELERGDVIVFRFPLDEGQRFEKRLIGLPGDEVRLQGEQLTIKRAGSSEFEPVARERLDRPCRDDNEQPLPHCTLYEETLDGRTYLVRYRLTTRARSPIDPPPQQWIVPEGHLFVLGDNRNDSLDSRRWTRADGTPAPFLPIELVESQMWRVWWPPGRWQAVR